MKYQRLLNNASELRPITEFDSFTVDDIADATGLSRQIVSNKHIALLKRCKAIEKNGKEFRGSRSKPRYEWEWKDEPLKVLTEYLDQQDQLPCGCRAHIPDRRQGPEGKAPCNVCETLHSIETYKNSL